MKLSEIKLISAYSTTEVDHKKRGRERFPLKEPSAKGSQKGVAGGGGRTLRAALPADEGQVEGAFQRALEGVG